MSGADCIRLRRLTKRFGALAALDGIDLRLADRQIVGVVGPDGAGKTTLLRCLAGLLEVEAEEARVLDFDLRGDVLGLKACTGYVPQVFSLQRELSVLENLRFTARLHRIASDDFVRRSTELLATAGLTAFVDRPAGALSGGMKQKLAVANALLAEPGLILLDEPTAGVDVVARADIWNLLRRESRRALVVVSTSYLDEADACDLLVYLDRGRVVATGTPAELRAATGLDLYRVWGDDPRSIARAARVLGYVEGTRATGRFACVEVRRALAPGTPRVLADLRGLSAVPVHLAEAIPVDMESTLRALARQVVG